MFIVSGTLILNCPWNSLRKCRPHLCLRLPTHDGWVLFLTAWLVYFIFPWAYLYPVINLPKYAQGFVQVYLCKLKIIVHKFMVGYSPTKQTKIVLLCAWISFRYLWTADEKFCKVEDYTQKQMILIFNLDTYKCTQYFIQTLPPPQTKISMTWLLSGNW